MSLACLLLRNATVVCNRRGWYVDTGMEQNLHSTRLPGGRQRWRRAAEAVTVPPAAVKQLSTGEFSMQMAGI
eukprot:COSAG01_NODE_30393_length_616_cov_8.367505_1_plen_71_part_10